MTKILPLLLLLLIAGCSSDETSKAETIPPPDVNVTGQQNHPPFQSITPQQAMQLIGTRKNLLILDTRTTGEIIQYGAIPSSRQADIRAIVNYGLPNPKNQPILVVCAVGGRSYGMGKFLVRKGHTEIYNLRGGLERWSREGFPVIYPKQ